MSAYHVVTGDLLDQEVDVIVNAWNRNVLPWWLLLPRGVSGAIMRRGGRAPFRELARAGVIPLGGAVLTTAGRLPFRAIIHVASINLVWIATRDSVCRSVRSALDLAVREKFGSIALPLLGGGTGGLDEQEVLSLFHGEISAHRYRGRIVVVQYPVRAFSIGRATSVRPAADEPIHPDFVRV
jgi:O-acetyl-ADP-ribose deacetylase (regulator of RNase III)